MNHESIYVVRQIAPCSLLAVMLRYVTMRRLVQAAKKMSMDMTNLMIIKEAWLGGAMHLKNDLALINYNRTVLTK